MVMWTTTININLLHSVRWCHVLLRFQFFLGLIGSGFPTCDSWSVPHLGMPWKDTHACAHTHTHQKTLIKPFFKVSNLEDGWVVYQKWQRGCSNPLQETDGGMYYYYSCNWLRPTLWNLSTPTVIFLYLFMELAVPTGDSGNSLEWQD